MRKLTCIVTASMFVLAGCDTVEEGTGVSSKSGLVKSAPIAAAASATLSATGSHKKTDEVRRAALISAGVEALPEGDAGTYIDREQKDLRLHLEGRNVYITRIGDSIVLNIPGDSMFTTGSADISGRITPVLSDVGAVLNQYPSTYIDVVGHADSQGSDVFNRDLSERRANAVAGFLVGRNVKAVRIYVAGMGKANPIASNDTPEGRARNRRVEILLHPVE